MSQSLGKEEPPTGSWRSLLPEDERQEYERGGWGRKVEVGRRPALLVIDMTRVMFDPDFALAPAAGAPAVVEAVSRLVRVGRLNEWPIFWTRRSSRRLPAEQGSTVWKYDTDFLPDSADEFVEPLVPLAEEYVIQKPKYSAFFETPLRSQLTYLHVDSLYICGMSTSGCVRASVVDAFSCNFRVHVVEEAVGDRSRFAHNANLLDIDMKFGTVIALDDIGHSIE